MKQFKMPKLLAKLSMAGATVRQNWDFYMQLSQAYAKDEIKFLKGDYGSNTWGFGIPRRWNNDKYEPVPLEETLKIPIKSQEKSFWVTFNDGWEVEVTFADRKIFYTVTCYDCDNFNGKRTGVKWKAVFTSKKYSQINAIESQINYSFTRHCEEVYEENLETQRYLEVKRIESELLTMAEAAI